MEKKYYYPENLSKKYKGRILPKVKGKVIFLVDIKGYKYEKVFPLSDFNNNREDAIKAAEEEKRRWNIENNLVINRYQIIDDYALVDLNKGHQMKMDLTDLKWLEKYNWKMQNKFSYPTTFIPLRKRSSINSDIAFFTFHEVVFGYRFVNHLNNDKLDYRRKNIKAVSSIQRDWKLNYLLKNRKKKNNNTSGFKGVFKVKTGPYEYWQVRGTDYQGKNINKKFSILQFGEELAKEKAIEFRKEIIEKSYERANDKSNV